MANSPAYDLLTQFCAATAYTAGTDAFVGVMPDKPDACVCFYDYSGGNPNPKFLVEYPTVKVIVRGGRHEYNSAYALADLVKDTLLGSGGVDINGTRYSGINITQDINYEGYDNNDRAGFTLSFYVTREPATSANRLPL